MLGGRDTHAQPSRAGESGMPFIAGIMVMAIVLGVALYAIIKTVRDVDNKIAASAPRTTGQASTESGR